VGRRSNFGVDRGWRVVTGLLAAWVLAAPLSARTLEGNVQTRPFDASPWMSFYGEASALGSVARVASTFWIIDVDLDPDAGNFTRPGRRAQEWRAQHRAQLAEPRFVRDVSFVLARGAGRLHVVRGEFRRARGDRISATGMRRDAVCAQGGFDLVRKLREKYPALVLVMQNATGNTTRERVTGDGWRRVRVATRRRRA
jgi:cysteinyl-tRNA synthetase